MNDETLRESAVNLSKFPENYSGSFVEELRDFVRRETRSPKIAEESHEGAQTVFRSEESDPALSEADVAREGLREAMVLVGEFHARVGIAGVQRLTELPETLDDGLEFAAAQLSTMAEHLMHVSHDEDRRLGRAAKLCEELGELLEAMSDRDEAGALDALADLAYVVLGTAVMLDLPLPEGFLEAHRSNMTKERLADDSDGEAVRGRGPGYSRADMAGVLERRRSPANPCASLRELIKDPPDEPNTYGTEPNRHSPHLMAEIGGVQACEHCGMPERQILQQRIKTGRPKCNGTPGVRL